MEDSTVFDRLVKNISRGERRVLLEKLGGASGPSISQEPLKSTVEETQTLDHAALYQRLKWWERLYIFFLRVLTKTSREEILENLVLGRLGRRIEKNFSGIYFHTSGDLGANFYWNLKKLEEKLFFLLEPFRKALGAGKKDFFAFLTGWEMPDIQDQLLSAIEPEQLAYEKSITDPYKLRKEIEFQIEDIIEGVEEVRKNMLYSRVRRLHALFNVVSFPYDKILTSFEKRSAEGFLLPISEIRSPLVDLTRTLNSAKSPPPEGLLKALFIFYLQSDFDSAEKTEELEKRLGSLMEKTEEAMDYIRFFHAHVPLINLARLALRNLEYRPEDLPGGEDWFVLFKQFWYERFEGKMKKYTEEFKRNQLLEQAREFLKSASYPVLTYYNQLGSSLGLYPKYTKSIGFIKGFLEKFFMPEMNSPLKLILIDGKFYREQNREEYNDAYNGIIWASERLRTIEAQLAPDGVIGQDIQGIDHEASSDLERSRKLRGILDRTDIQVEEIITKVLEHVGLLKNVVGGILHGDVGGRYDTLSNMGYIGRHENKNLLQKLTSANTRIDTFIELLGQLYDSEKRTG
jgi:hypothetical protein